MILTRKLKIAVISQWAFVFAAFIANILEEQYLPDNLVAYVANRANAELYTAETLTLMALIPFLFAYALSSIGLILKKSWAPKTYLFCILVGLLITALRGLKIGTPIYSTLWEVTAVLAGFIVCLVYLSPLKEEFKLVPQNPFK